jgi:hypothetical protein
MKCDQCQWSRINGKFCHERGCPNDGKRYEDGSWVRYVKCFECDVREGEVCCAEPPMRLMIQLNRQAIVDLQYAVVVEAWDKKDFGRGKRAYMAEFTAGERGRITELYKLFYAWHLRTGVPEARAFHPSTIALIQRTTDFFARL